MYISHLQKKVSFRTFYAFFIQNSEKVEKNPKNYQYTGNGGID